MSKLQELAQLGQSIWYDNISRGLMDAGELQALIAAGVTGVTSNPTIFHKAITGSPDYDQTIQTLVAQGSSVQQIYETLALADIRRAADLLRPVYERTDGADGHVSLEVSPDLADDTDGTIAEARRLFAALGRPNVMIKVPATEAGIPAVRRLIGEGININITLIFSLANYEAVAAAYIAGLQDLVATGGKPGRVASVASFFVSRVDSAVDKALAGSGADGLLGAIGIANAKVAYARFEQIFSGQPWEELVAQGARPQRPLWASTGVKNPAYPDTLYVDNLIGPHTVNTVPPATLDALIDHGNPSQTLTEGVAEAQAQLAQLAQAGVDLDAITEQLQRDGVASFAQSFAALMAGVAQKRQQMVLEGGGMQAALGSAASTVAAALDEMAAQKIVERIWAHDHTVWRPDPTEIANRLGWLRIAERMQDQVTDLNNLATTVDQEGYTHAVLLGMGGSSLAPEVFAKTLASADGLTLLVLDSTDPDQVATFQAQLDPARTLFIVATKSGGTVETLSGFKYFYNWTLAALGPDQAGQHFVAITDPGSRLVDLAQRYKFRRTFLNDPNIGGRYSALSHFGLVPGALVGVDLAILLQRAIQAGINSGGAGPIALAENPSAQLGAILGELAKAGRDKVTLVTSPGMASFGDWVEQLIAESTGKEGKGILPVVGETVGSPEVYGPDRLFVSLSLIGEDDQSPALDALQAAGHPVVRLVMADKTDLSAQMFVWEMATAIAGYRLDIQPFDQPNVEAAKVLARQMVDAYMATGELPAGAALPPSADALADFLTQAQPGDYISLHAYVQPTAQTDIALATLRSHLRTRTGLAVTVGYGPRFLHSTGQLHKGDGGNGIFVQFTSDPMQDLAIPDEAGSAASTMTFGVLKMAQALGDGKALAEAGRRVIRFHLGKDVVGGLAQLS